MSYVYTIPGLHSNNAFADNAFGLLTRNWTISGIEQFQSGSYSTFDTAGFDTNGDGSAFNDRPLIGNGHAPLATAGIDGFWVGGNTGTFYDVASALNGNGSLTPVNANSVHFLIPYQPNNENLHQEIGRNSFRNPGSTTNDIALEKGFGSKYLHLERGQFVLRGEVQNLGNHNDVGILDTSTTDIGSPNFLNRSNARQATQSNAPFNYGRNIVLWGKLTF